MIYREYGKTGKELSALGFGSTRFNSNDLNDDEGIKKCSDLIVKASELGVNFFDIAHNYSKSQCEKIYRDAFKKMKNTFYITAKTSSFQDNTAEDVMRRVNSSLKNMDVDKIDFFYMWSIMNEEHYRDIMKVGGAYEGALKAKKMGLIDHIVFSNHAVPKVALKIIEEGMFEGITLSYNLLNFKLMDPVLKAACKKNMGVTIMNPLAGGIIPQNQELFKNIVSSEFETVPQASLSFIYSHPEVTSVLSGISREGELLENIEALSDAKRMNVDRIVSVEDKLKQMEGLCTGCGYCVNSCPQKIDIPERMQSYNMSFFDKAEVLYGKRDRELLKRISVLKKMTLDFHKTPSNSNNDCIKCGKCEKICTQHLPIIDRLEELSLWIKKSCGSKSQYSERLDGLLHNKNYKRVAFYTAGGYTAFVLGIYEEFFCESKFEISLFDSNESRWGDFVSGYEVFNPSEIENIKPDCIIISNYIYSDEIYEDIKSLSKFGIDVLKLHRPDDVPWVF